MINKGLKEIKLQWRFVNVGFSYEKKKHVNKSPTFFSDHR